MTQRGGEQRAREKHRGVPHFKEQSGGDAHGVLRPPVRPCNERPGQPRRTHCLCGRLRAQRVPTAPRAARDAGPHFSSPVTIGGVWADTQGFLKGSTATPLAGPAGREGAGPL